MVPNDNLKNESKNDDKTDQTKKSNESYLIPNFEFLRLIKDYPQLFTVFGVFGAISVYLNTLIKVDNNNSLFNQYIIINNNSSSLNQLTGEPIYKYIMRIIAEIIKDPNILFQCFGLSPSNSVLLNIAVIASLTIFIILGLSILRIYDTKYYKGDLNVPDLLLWISFIILIGIVSLFVFLSQLSTDYMKIILTGYISSLLFYFILTILKGDDFKKLLEEKKNYKIIDVITLIVLIYIIISLLSVTISMTFILLFFIFGIKLNSLITLYIIAMSWLNIIIASMFVIIPLSKKVLNKYIVSTSKKFIVKIPAEKILTIAALAIAITISIIYLLNITNYIYIGIIYLIGLPMLFVIVAILSDIKKT